MFTHFNHSQFRRYILAFGSLFSRIELVRTDAQGVEVQHMTVPLVYGPKERWYTRLITDPQLHQGVSQVVPAMSYEVTGISYDTSRKLNTLNVMNFPTDEQRKRARMYVGVPYTLTFELGILVKLQQDGLQIVEQIFPYFTPDLTFALNVIPELGLTDQVPITLLSVNSTDDYEGSFEKIRSITWKMTFSMKVYFYGPRRKQSRIEEIMVDFFASSGDLIPPPVLLSQEQGGLFENEDGSDGHLVDEATANTYIGTEKVATLTTVADPLDQNPTSKDNITSVTTLEEFVDGSEN